MLKQHLSRSDLHTEWNQTTASLSGFLGVVTTDNTEQKYELFIRLVYNGDMKADGAWLEDSMHGGGQN